MQLAVEWWLGRVAPSSLLDENHGARFACGRLPNLLPCCMQVADLYNPGAMLIPPGHSTEFVTQNNMAVRVVAAVAVWIEAGGTGGSNRHGAGVVAAWLLLLVLVPAPLPLPLLALPLLALPWLLLKAS